METQAQEIERLRERWKQLQAYFDKRSGADGSVQIGEMLDEYMATVKELWQIRDRLKYLGVEP